MVSFLLSYYFGFVTFVALRNGIELRGTELSQFFLFSEFQSSCSVFLSEFKCKEKWVNGVAQSVQLLFVVSYFE